MQKQNEYRIIFLNSLVFFLLAYFLVFLIQQFAVALTASLFDYTVLIFHDHYGFILDKTSWTHDSVKLVFSSTPVISLIIGGLFLIVYMKVRIATGLLRQLFYWGYVYAFCFFFGSVFVGGFTNQGFGHVLHWSYVTDTGRMLHAIISLTGLGLIGALNTRSTLLLANSYFKNLTDRNRLKFVLFQTVLPYFAGMLILSLYSLPYDSEREIYHLIVTACMLIPIVITFLKSGEYQELLFDEDKKIIKPGFAYLIYLLVVMVSLYLLFSHGWVVNK
ncbi:MAG: hypothetical protein K9H15_11135 [Bacteroidales bacterium]|nr:hypothetical protein [Bacteroidales bacterium]